MCLSAVVSAKNEDEDAIIIRQSIIKCIEEIAVIHIFMEERFRNVHSWLIEAGIHASYVQVMMEDIDIHYLRPSVNMAMIERTNFTEMYRRFRGTGRQFFNLPTILTLYIMNSRLDFGEEFVKSAIHEGVYLCKRNQILLEKISSMLDPFGMKIEQQAKTCLLRSSLNLMPMSSCWCMYTDNVLVKLSDSSSCCWDAIEMHVSNMLLSASMIHHENERMKFDDNTDPISLRCMLEDFYDREERSINLVMAPWIGWTPKNHIWIVAPWARSVTKEGLMVLQRHGISGDLAVKIMEFIFTTE